MDFILVANEFSPLVETENSRSLSYDLRKLALDLKKDGEDVKVFIPEYTEFMKEKHLEELEHVDSFYINGVYIGVNKYNYNGIEVYLIDNKDLFGTRKTLDSEEDYEYQFSYFASGILEFLTKTDWDLDFIHLNDPETLPFSYYYQNFNNDKQFKETVLIYQKHDELKREFTKEIFDIVFGEVDINLEFENFGEENLNKLLNFDIIPEDVEINPDSYDIILKEVKDNYKININRASLRKLIRLKGVGENTARNIIKYRKEHGEIKEAEELTNIKGIGKGTIKKLKKSIDF